MADAELSPPSYFKYALKDQHNLVLLFGAAAFSAAFASPWPLVVGASGELLWLLVGPRLPGFRGWVDRQLSIQYLARAETAIQGALGELPEAEAARFVALSQGVTELALRSGQRLAPREQQLAQHALLELRRTFLDYQFLGQRVESLVDSTPTADLEKEAAQLQESYGTERELTARMSIRQALTLVQRRMTQQAELAAVQKKLGVCLEMLEKTLPTLEARLTDPGFAALAPELDAELAQVGSADTLEIAVDEIFASQNPVAAP